MRSPRVETTKRTERPSSGMKIDFFCKFALRRVLPQGLNLVARTRLLYEPAFSPVFPVMMHDLAISFYSDACYHTIYMMQGNVVLAIVSVGILMFSVVIHEVAHGYAALYFGDKTAFYAGRLSMNPIVHLDWLGSVILPIGLTLLGSPMIFGWARPVPVNPRNFSGTYDDLWVSLAGPATNIALALIVAIVRTLTVAPGSSTMFGILLAQVVIVNCVLAFFNMIPVPPLDGFHVLRGLLGHRAQPLTNFLIRYQFVGLLVILFFAEYIVSIPAMWLARFLLGI